MSRTVPVKILVSGRVSVADPRAPLGEPWSEPIIYHITNVPAEITASEVVRQFERVTILPLAARQVDWAAIVGQRQGAIIHA